MKVILELNQEEWQLIVEALPLAALECKRRKQEALEQRFWELRAELTATKRDAPQSK